MLFDLVNFQNLSNIDFYFYEEIKTVKREKGFFINDFYFIYDFVFILILVIINLLYIKFHFLSLVSCIYNHIADYKEIRF